ncbi:hypothetical protein EK904_007783 [Melospiza melodia maxima]|nr:hypothetical protein EK904_007783 [Melospiza melodia maxima]
MEDYIQIFLTSILEPPGMFREEQPVFWLSRKLQKKDNSPFLILPLIIDENLEKEEKSSGLLHERTVTAMFIRTGTFESLRSSNQRYTVEAVMAVMSEEEDKRSTLLLD